MPDNIPLANRTFGLIVAYSTAATFCKVGAVRPVWLQGHDTAIVVRVDIHNHISLNNINNCRFAELNDELSQALPGVSSEGSQHGAGGDSGRV